MTIPDEQMPPQEKASEEIARQVNDLLDSPEFAMAIERHKTLHASARACARVSALGASRGPVVTSVATAKSATCEQRRNPTTNTVRGTQAPAPWHGGQEAEGEQQ
jgi:hypothetical protein